MMRKVTPKSTLTFFKVVTALAFSWPLQKSAGKFQVIIFKTLRFLFCVNIIILIIPLIYTLYLNEYDVSKTTKLACLLAAFIQALGQMILCILQYDRFQYVISEMQYHLECAEGYQMEIYQQYVDRCMIFYTCSVMAVFLDACGISLYGPLTTDENLPTETKYPFEITNQSLKLFIFFNQFMVVWQCFSMVCFISVVSYILWFTSARFSVLCQQFRIITCNADIMKCIQQHHETFRFTQEVLTAVRSVILLMIIACSSTFILSGLTIVGRSTLEDRMAFIVMWIAGLMELFTCAWSADHLIEASTNVGDAAYESPWYNNNAIYQKSIYYIILRSQIPTGVTPSSVMPVLSLKYYASLVSTAFSYLMTLRILFVENDKD